MRDRVGRADRGDRPYPRAWIAEKRMEAEEQACFWEAS